MLAADFLTRTAARFNAGTVPRLDVIKAHVDVAQADNDLIACTRDVSNANAAAMGAGRDEAVPPGIVYAVGISMPIPLMF